MKFNETPKQEAYLNSLIESGYAWNTPMQVLINGDWTGVTREQFEARDGWIVWRGGERPVGGDEVVEVVDCQTGKAFVGKADNFYWSGGLHVKAYRLHKDKPQGHPHAELMAQYAEDAKTSAEPWKLWEIHDICTGWIGLKTEFSFHAQAKYRRKPKTKLIHGVEVPDISYTPENGELYVHCDPSHCNLYTVQYECSSGNDRHMVEQGLAYPNTEEGKQAAILHAKAMLGINDD